MFYSLRTLVVITRHIAAAYLSSKTRIHKFSNLNVRKICGFLQASYNHQGVDARCKRHLKTSNFRFLNIYSRHMNPVDQHENFKSLSKRAFCTFSHVLIWTVLGNICWIQVNQCWPNICKMKSKMIKFAEGAG